MQYACGEGKVDVCQWLYKVGARDTHTPNDAGETLFYTASLCGRLEVCKWLIVHGALSGKLGHVDAADMRKSMHIACTAQFQEDLLAWAEQQLVVRHIFLHVVLPGTHPNSGSPLSSLAGRVQLIAEFVGVLQGPVLRDVRESIQQLQALVIEDQEDQVYSLKDT